MASSSTRSQIVVRALELAGRDVRLRSSAEQWLNDMLRSWALEYKYPSLRKTGALTTLSQGSTMADLPSDLGAGTDNLLFGVDRKPLYERSMDEFVAARGFPGTGTGSGTPAFYATDEQAGKFLFNCPADRAFEFVPVYYYLPANPPLGSSGDNLTLWMDNDHLIVQGLIEIIYQYKGDEREMVQAQKVIAIRDAYRRGKVPMGGGSNRITLARNRFK